jgi:hypothetical protein
MDAKANVLETDPDRLLARFLKFGRSTAVAAARNALAEAGVETAEITGLVVNTCTGYLHPGLSSYIAEDLGLKTSVRFQDLMGMGCGAAIPFSVTAPPPLSSTCREKVVKTDWRKLWILRRVYFHDTAKICVTGRKTAACGII